MKQKSAMTYLILVLSPLEPEAAKAFLDAAQGKEVTVQVQIHHKDALPASLPHAHPDPPGDPYSPYSGLSIVAGLSATAVGGPGTWTIEPGGFLRRK